MSAGEAHDSSCEKVLRDVYFFIDHELESADAAEIQRHLDECGPCLDEVALERLVKQLIARSCAERAPVELRQRVVFSIRQVQLQISSGQTAPRLDEQR